MFEFDVARRRFLGVGGVALSGSAVALLAGRDVLAAAEKAANPANDVSILNSALAAELEAIAAYGVGAGSGLLKGPVLALATTFQGHHKQHADVLAGTVRKLGGTPVEAKAKYTFPVETLKTQNDVLRFAGNLEKGAVSAYVGAVPLFKDRELAKAAASILGDEAMHWAVLRNAVGEEPVPAAFVSSGQAKLDCQERGRGCKLPSMLGIHH
ncbi:MAG TPA: ferritin-like domain-containing protein, partial [Steroidobacteraceae bacterium]